MSKPPPRCPFVIVADWNEFLPQHLGYRFEQIDPPVEVVTGNLNVGDYTVAGMESRVTVERKTLGDLYGSFGSRKRDNMIERIQLMNSFEFAAVVVEATYVEVMSGYPHSRVHPRSLSGTIVALKQRYKGVHWEFMPDRECGERMTFRILERFYNDHIQDNANDQAEASR
jgi:DNA excision repair protein ERCC-4